MSFEMRLWNVNGKTLKPMVTAVLDQEMRLEDWIENDPSILGLDLLVIGRQVQTAYRGRIDLLALDADANCYILELKKGKTPREVVAQLLDYGSWIKDQGFAELDNIAREHRGQPLSLLFQLTFNSAIPETVNETHHLVVVASSLDDSSERIIAYLQEEHSLSINAVFFNFFSDGANELLGRAWLRDPQEIKERADVRKRNAPWSGYYFVNLGEGEHRNWYDNCALGFVSAGQAPKYSRPLKTLQVGDRIFGYLKGTGYVGYGEVVSTAVPIREALVQNDPQRPLLAEKLKAQDPGENKDSDDDCEWVVGVSWKKAFPKDQAKTFRGVFANQNIVCKLRDERTLKFLKEQFGIDDE